MAPVIADYWERAEFPHTLVPSFAALGLAGGPIKGYGCPVSAGQGRQPGTQSGATGTEFVRFAEGEGSCRRANKANYVIGREMGRGCRTLHSLMVAERATLGWRAVLSPCTAGTQSHPKATPPPPPPRAVGK